MALPVNRRYPWDVQLTTSIQYIPGYSGSRLRVHSYPGIPSTGGIQIPFTLAGVYQGTVELTRGVLSSKGSRVIPVTAIPRGGVQTRGYIHRIPRSHRVPAAAVIPWNIPSDIPYNTRVQ